MASLESFKTLYPKQEVLQREISLSLNGYIEGAVKVTYGMTRKINETIQQEEYHNSDVFWSNDAPDSLFKIGYDQKYANLLTCNANLNKGDKPVDKDGNRNYYTYNCLNHFKLLYFADFNQTSAYFDFRVYTPPYTAIPYEYIHEIDILGRRMNSFNMYLSSRLATFLEAMIQVWTKQIGLQFNPIYSTQLVSHTKKKPLGEVKIQMCVHPNYLYWVVETLIRNYPRLRPHGVEQFKFSYLVGEYKLNTFAEIYPNTEPGVGINSYGDYRREVLNPPNVVFFLNRDPNLKPIADILCELFPERYDITFGVPRFNMRLNRNVYISFEGHNERKYDLLDLVTPREYARILETKNPRYNELSETFSGHTLMHEDGSENNIQSYKKLLRGSFKEVYTRYGLLDYYEEVFGPFNREMEREQALKSKSRFKSWANSVTRSRKNAIVKTNTNAKTKSKSRFKSWAKSIATSRKHKG